MQLNRAFRLHRRELVAFVGGGGKTTAMFRLAEELASQGRRVVTTTTTRIFAAQIALAPRHLIHTEEAPTDELLAALARQLAEHPHVLVIGRPDFESGKAAGLAPGVVEAIAALPEVDAVLVEADGSRMRPFKAPAGHEPVVPEAASLLVPVVGVDVLGAPLTDRAVHRAARVAELAGVAPGAAVTPGVVAAVLTHRAGGLKGLPAGARVVPLVNKIEDPDRLAGARQLAGRLLAHQAVDGVVLGAVQRQEPAMEVWERTAAVILAAGAATRFGAPKQLLPWAGDTLLGHVVDAALASQADPVVVVLGRQAEACLAALGGRPARVVFNPDWEEGQSSSVRAGLAALPAHVGAALFPLVDQPGVTPAVLDALIRRHRTTLAPAIWPEHEGRRGNPVLFDRSVFPELMRLSGDTGGRAVLRAYLAQAERVPVNEPGILFDIDTPNDYAAALGSP